MIRIALLLPLLTATAAAAPLRSVAFDDFNGMCAVDARGAIHCTDAFAYPTVDTPANSIVMVSYAPIVVKPDGTLVRVRDKLEPIDAGFPVRTAGLIGIKKKLLCVLGTKGEFGCAPYDDRPTKLALTRAKGTFVSLAVQGDSVWALDDKGTLWCQGGRNCARMYVASKGTTPPLLAAAVADAYPIMSEVPDAPLYRVADNVVRLVPSSGDTCIEQARANALVCWDWGTAPRAVSLPKADELAIAGSYLCARARDSITCTFLASGRKSVIEPPKPVTFTVKGATRMYSGSPFCVEDANAALSCTEKFAEPKLAPVTWAARKTAR